MYAVTSRLFMERYPLGFYSISRHCATVYPMGSIHKKYFLLGLLKKPPTPFRDASVDPVHVVG